MDEIISITASVNPTISEQQMRRQSLSLVRMFGRIYSHHRNPKQLVADIHEWLRVYEQVPFKDKGWNFFLAVLQHEGCNCFCSSIFILLICWELGLFPSSIQGAYSDEHIFIVTSDRTEAFETTEQCKTVWVPLTYMIVSEGLKRSQDDFMYVETIDDLISLYVSAIISFERPPIVLIRALVTKYVSEGDILLAMMGFILDGATYLPLLERSLNLIKRSKAGRALSIRLNQLKLQLTLSVRNYSGANRDKILDLINLIDS